MKYTLGMVLAGVSVLLRLVAVCSGILAFLAFANPEVGAGAGLYDSFMELNMAWLMALAFSVPAAGIAWGSWVASKRLWAKGWRLMGRLQEDSSSKI